MCPLAADFHLRKRVESPHTPKSETVTKLFSRVRQTRWRDLCVRVETMETLTLKSGLHLRQNGAQVDENIQNGEVAERLNAPVLKTGRLSRVSRVRISPSPPIHSVF